MSRRRILFNVLALVVTLLALLVRREGPAWRLITAAANGDLAAAGVALAAGVPPDARAVGLPGSMNALWFAAYKGDLPIARLLLAYGADPTLAWKQARLTGDPKLLALLLAAGARVTPAEVGSVCGEAARLHQEGDRAALNLLMQTEPAPVDACAFRVRGKGVNRRFTGGKTLLQCAAGASAAGVCRYLIARGADVNAKDDTGQTALLYAVRRVVTTQNDDGETVLKDAVPGAVARKGEAAALGGEAAALGVVEVLLASGAPPDAPEYLEGKTAQDYAVKFGYGWLAERLRRAGSVVPAARKGRGHDTGEADGARRLGVNRP